MLKFLAKIQFSIEMTMWLIVYVAQLRILKTLAEDVLAGMGATLPALTKLFLNPAIWLHWWMVPVVACALAVIEWKFTIPKWLQWAARSFLFALIWLTIYLTEMPFLLMCEKINDCSL